MARCKATFQQGTGRFHFFPIGCRFYSGSPAPTTREKLQNTLYTYSHFIRRFPIWLTNTLDLTTLINVDSDQEPAGFTSGGEMTATAASLNNPSPANWQNITYTVQSGDSLWKVAMQIAIAEAKANGQNLSGNDLNVATANELALIEKTNPQIVGSGGSGTYDLIYPGDKIAIPVQTPSTSVPAATAKTGAAGFNAPSSPQGIENGLWEGHTSLKPGEDILSADGKYDLVMLSNGDLALYQLKTPYQHSENYAGDTVVWQSGTVGQPVAYAAQDGGNIVLYASDGTAVKSIPESSLPTNLFQVSEGPPNDGLLIGGSGGS